MKELAHFGLSDRVSEEIPKFWTNYLECFPLLIDTEHLAKATPNSEINSNISKWIICLPLDVKFL